MTWRCRGPPDPCMPCQRQPYTGQEPAGIHRRSAGRAQHRMLCLFAAAAKTLKLGPWRPHLMPSSSEKPITRTGPGSSAGGSGPLSSARTSSRPGAASAAARRSAPTRPAHSAACVRNFVAMAVRPPPSHSPFRQTSGGSFCSQPFLQPAAPGPAPAQASAPSMKPQALPCPKPILPSPHLQHRGLDCRNAHHDAQRAVVLASIHHGVIVRAHLGGAQGAGCRAESGGAMPVLLLWS